MIGLKVLEDTDKSMSKPVALPRKVDVIVALLET